MEYSFENVNGAFYGLVKAFHEKKLPLERKKSRAGEVLSCVEPVLIKYALPRERVLFNSARDANPFFHLFEALWMLAGQNDVATLKFYNSKIGEIASDDGLIFNGAYGYRWRNANQQVYQGDGGWVVFDQLSFLISHLRNNMNSRRAVLQMWNVEDDLLNVDKVKDVCCNTAVYFQVKNEELHMTVTNRSNDLIWGLLGANYVHFTMLQEYMANCLGVALGDYNHFTNDLHVYEDNWEPERWLAPYYRTKEELEVTAYSQLVAPKGCRLVQDKEVFDQEVKEFVTSPAQEFREPFLEHVAKPMCLAFAAHKQRNYARAIGWCSLVASDDWGLAATTWINKRLKAWSEKGEACSN